MRRYCKMVLQISGLSLLAITLVFVTVLSWMGAETVAQAPWYESFTNQPSQWWWEKGNKSHTLCRTNNLVSHSSAAKKEKAGSSTSSATSATSSSSTSTFSGCPQNIDSTAFTEGTVDDRTEHTYSVPAGPIGSFADCQITRTFGSPIQSIQVIIESGQADDIGYVGNTQVTDTKPMCAAIGEVTAPVDVTSQVTTNGNVATLTLRAQENCCCATGWGVATPVGRLNAMLHWVVALVPIPNVEITKASISEHQFVIELGPASSTGKFVLKMRNSADQNEVELKTIDAQAGGAVTMELDDVIEKLSGSNLKFFDSAIATWTINGVEYKSKPKFLDVPKVQVLSQWTISNYFTPTWQGEWGGQLLTKGVYPAGQFPQGLRNVELKTGFLDSQDPRNQGLAVDGDVITRPHKQRAVEGFPQYEFLDLKRKGYIENPDRDQHTAGGCKHVKDIHATTVAVHKTRNKNLQCADEVYIPQFRIRTVDDHGGGLALDQIDVWMGQGDQAVKDEADQFDEHHTVLKIIRPKK